MRMTEHHDILPQLLGPIAQISLHISFYISVSVRQPNFIAFYFQILIKFAAIIQQITVAAHTHGFYTCRIMQTVGVGRIITCMQPQLDRRCLLQNAANRLRTAMRITCNAYSHFFLLQIATSLRIALPRWLILFFSCMVASAIPLCSSVDQNSGS